MLSSRLPVLWICGAPATGKSTVAWRLFGDVADEGVRVAYVDIDQLGMLYPAPEGDADRHLVKVAGLAAVIPQYCAAGARALIVSGVIDPRRGRDFADRASADASFTFCHLMVADAVVRHRLAARGWPDAAADDSVSTMRALEQADFLDSTIDATGLEPGAVASRARALLRPIEADVVRPDLPAAIPGDQEGARSTPSEVTVVCGPRAVGKSTVSWAAFTQNVDAGVRTGFLDLEQIAFMRPSSNDDDLCATNFGALTRTFARHGAQTLIANGNISGPIAAQGVRRACAPTPVRIVRLTANADTYRHRIAQRGASDNGVRLAGDNLLNSSDDTQRAVLRQALQSEKDSARRPFEDLLVDTNADGPELLAARIRHGSAAGR